MLPFCQILYVRVWLVSFASLRLQHNPSKRSVRLMELPKGTFIGKISQQRFTPELHAFNALIIYLRFCPESI